MDNTMKIQMLRTRRELLQARGPHNVRIVAKIDRQIRMLEKNNEN